MNTTERFQITLWRRSERYPKSRVSWRYRVNATNGRIVAASTEGFRHRNGATANMRQVIGWAPELRMLPGRKWRYYFEIDLNRSCTAIVWKQS